MRTSLEGYKEIPFCNYSVMIIQPRTWLGYWAPGVQTCPLSLYKPSWTPQAPQFLVSDLLVWVKHFPSEERPSSAAGPKEEVPGLGRGCSPGLRDSHSNDSNDPAGP